MFIRTPFAVIGDAWRARSFAYTYKDQQAIVANNDRCSDEINILLVLIHFCRYVLENYMKISRLPELQKIILRLEQGKRKDGDNINLPKLSSRFLH